MPGIGQYSQIVAEPYPVPVVEILTGFGQHPGNCPLACPAVHELQLGACTVLLQNIADGVQVKSFTANNRHTVVRQLRAVHFGDITPDQHANRRPCPGQ
ncbi:hypothetical protein D3C80_1715640 [compost metagenome]